MQMGVSGPIRSKTNSGSSTGKIYGITRNSSMLSQTFAATTDLKNSTSRNWTSSCGLQATRSETQLNHRGLARARNGRDWILGPRIFIQCARHFSRHRPACVNPTHPAESNRRGNSGRSASESIVHGRLCGHPRRAAGRAALSRYLAPDLDLTVAKPVAHQAGQIRRAPATGSSHHLMSGDLRRSGSLR